MATNTEPEWYLDMMAKYQEPTPTPVMVMTAPPENNIVLNAGETEMLRVSEDGFYVRGVRVAADADEAKKVYESFKQWLAWAQLNR